MINAGAHEATDPGSNYHYLRIEIVESFTRIISIIKEGEKYYSEIVENVCSGSQKFKVAQFYDYCEVIRGHRKK